MSIYPRMVGSCKQCGKEIWATRYIEKNKVFCDTACRNTYNKLHLRDRVQLTCPVCGKSFEAIPSRLQRDNTHCCSLKCSGELQFAGQSRKYPLVVGRCAYCNGDIVANCSSEARAGRIYCSHSCQAKAQAKTRVVSQRTRQVAADLAKKRVGRFRHSLVTREQISQSTKGDRHWNWQGGKSNEERRLRRSYKLKYWSRLVKERDSYICQRCGASETKVVAHHIQPFMDFPELRLVLDNGQTLCEPCHAIVDRQLRATRKGGEGK